MKYKSFSAFSAFIVATLAFASVSYAESPKHVEQTVAAHTFKTSVEAPKPLKVGQENKITVKIQYAGDGMPVTEKDLDIVHTRKVHLLVVDESLTDYHHLHPVAGSKPGTYTASFVPAKADNYKVWIEITVAGAHQFLSVNLKGEKPCSSSCIDRKVSDTGASDGLKAVVSFDGALQAETEAMGLVKITDMDGKPITDLEPVMGAFAHIVGFYDDFKSIVHVHPMGKEPTAQEQRGGPDLAFHIEPEKAGYLKLYVQVRRNEQDIFIPFGLTVQ